MVPLYPKEYSQAISESVSLTDAATGDRNTELVELSETITLTDAASKGQSVSQDISESVSLTDSISLGRSVTQVINEELSLTDAVTGSTRKQD